MCQLRPSFTSERTFGRCFSALHAGVDMLVLAHKVQVYPTEQPIQVHSIGAGDMSHGRALALMIILITASSSSETKKDARWLEMCESGGT